MAAIERREFIKVAGTEAAIAAASPFTTFHYFSLLFTTFRTYATTRPFRPLNISLLIS